MRIYSFLLLLLLQLPMGAKAQTGYTLIPTTGTCALILNLPIPYGFDVASNTTKNNVRGVYETGYNFIGLIQFIGNNSMKLSGRVINPTFRSSDGPYIANGSSIDINDLPGTVTQLSKSNGFDGGYKFTFSGSAPNAGQIGLVMTAVVTNGGKSIMLVNSEGSGMGPGSGVCQF